MKPIVVNGDLWRVVRVTPSHPSLIDRTGSYKLATANPVSKTISISTAVPVNQFDSVLLHEVAHAITISYNLLEPLHHHLPPAYWITVEEWAVQLIEHYSIEALALTSKSLGRPICIKGYCTSNLM